MKSVVTIFTVLFMLCFQSIVSAEIFTKCTPTAAYNQGIQDGETQQMEDMDFGFFCSDQIKGAINRAYHLGYKYGSQRQNSDGTGYQCVDSFGTQVCGYHCITSMGNTLCATTAEQQCITDGFGKIACGYGCVKTMNDLRCSHYPQENCVADDFGHIRCGINCRIDFGQIKCDNGSPL